MYMYTDIDGPGRSGRISIRVTTGRKVRLKEAISLAARRSVHLEVIRDKERIAQSFMRL